MHFIKKVWLGEFGLGFTFWVMGCLAPAPIFAAKFYLRNAGVFAHQETAVFIAGQAFLWLEWLYFVFITVALWNSATNHLKRARRGESKKRYGVTRDDYSLELPEFLPWDRLQTCPG